MRPLALGAFAIGFYFMNPPAAEADGGLLQLSDLPAEAQLWNEGSLPPEDLAHPLSTAGVEAFAKRWATAEVEALFSYQAVHSISAMLPIEGVMVLNFTYTYPDAATAAHAAALVQSDIQGQMKLLQPPTTETGVRGLSGQSFFFQGDEGDSVYWFVGAQDKVLVLLLVNGLKQDTVTTTFEEVRAILLGK